MTVYEAAKRLSLAVPTVYQMVRDGIIPARRIGPKRGKIILDEADVDRYWKDALNAPATDRTALKHLKAHRG